MDVEQLVDNVKYFFFNSKFYLKTKSLLKTNGETKVKYSSLERCYFVVRILVILYSHYKWVTEHVPAGPFSGFCGGRRLIFILFFLSMYGLGGLFWLILFTLFIFLFISCSIPQINIRVILYIPLYIVFII